MRDEVAGLVYPVLSYGLRLRERLDRGEALLLETEQAALLGLLLSEEEARRWTEFGGEATDGLRGRADGPSQAHAERFLGIRYALTSWLDELFIADSSWSVQWTERKLEAALYATNDRAWRFWEQARLASTRPESDALEGYFLCVMLGFRGDLGDKPEQLDAWVAAARARILRGLVRGWPAPPSLEPSTRVPPLQGSHQLRTVVLAVGIGMLLLMPAIAILLAWQSE
jgi:type VI secretion system protein ImpK